MAPHRSHTFGAVQGTVCCVACYAGRDWPLAEMPCGAEGRTYQRGTESTTADGRTLRARHDEDFPAMAEMYQGGASQREVARFYKTSLRVIGRALKAQGVTARPGKRVKK